MKIILRQIAFGLLFFSIIILSGCKEKQVVFSQIDSICELATLECYYHNVAEYEYKGDNGIFSSWTNKKTWIQYGGIVKIGIDASKVQVDKPSKKDVVTVKIPKATILSVNVDKESIKEGITETGKLTSITTEDKVEALAEAQKSMYEAVSAESSLLYQGQKRAKMIIEKYIINVGNQIGKHFEVEWEEID